FEPRPAQAGRAELAALAQLTGGVERLSVDGLFERGEQAHAQLPLETWLIAAALLLMLLEVALRRMLVRTVAARPIPSEAAPGPLAPEPHASDAASQPSGDPGPRPTDGTASALEALKARRKRG
ncbi:MAG: hypothetical protein ACK4N5_14710, partial [Myxococcales bacterium]